MSAPDLHQSSRADSLIPDSLIPDSKSSSSRTTTSVEGVDAALPAAVFQGKSKTRELTEMRAEQWPKSSETARALFGYVEDSLILRIVREAIMVCPKVTDGQIAEAMLVKHTTMQHSAALFVTTVPEYLRAIQAGAAVRSASVAGHGAVDYPEYKRPSWRDDPERKPH
jgi:hypothetical protein